jgi:NAD(P)H dehydrogenase (quinone)
MSTLITGASGHLGRLVIASLLERGVPAGEIVAGARDTASVADLADLGVVTRHLDYDDPASISAALDGVDKVLLISASTPGQRAIQHGNVIDAVAAAGIQYLVYTSAPKATTSALILAPEHKATEEAIAASGIPAVILRNGWYTENYAGQVGQAAATGELVASVGDGRVSSASRKDFAEAAAVALVEDGHLGKVYELSGDVSWDYTELAAAITTVTGKDVAYRAVTPEEHAALLTAAGLDAGTIGFVVALDGNTREGLLGETSGDLARLIGRPTTPLVEGLRAAL